MRGRESERAAPAPGGCACGAVHGGWPPPLGVVRTLPATGRRRYLPSVPRPVSRDPYPWQLRAIGPALPRKDAGLGTGARSGLRTPDIGLRTSDIGLGTRAEHCSAP